MRHVRGKVRSLSLVLLTVPCTVLPEEPQTKGEVEMSCDEPKSFKNPEKGFQIF